MGFAGVGMVSVARLLRKSALFTTTKSNGILKEFYD